MGDLSVVASKFNISSVSLKEFDDALRLLKKREEIVKTAEMEEHINKLLKVINPISKAIKGELSASIEIDERHIVSIIKNRHSRDWPAYKEQILQLNSKLKSPRFRLTRSDIDILNDIADALDIECGNLFRRLSEK